MIFALLDAIVVWIAVGRLERYRRVEMKFSIMAAIYTWIQVIISFVLFVKTWNLNYFQLLVVSVVCGCINIRTIFAYIEDRKERK